MTGWEKKILHELLLYTETINPDGILEIIKSEICEYDNTLFFTFECANEECFENRIQALKERGIK